MRRLSSFWLPVLLAGHLVPSAARATEPVPGSLKIQGVLRNVAGELVTGQYSFTFWLFADSTCAEDSDGCVLSKSVQTLNVTGGLFETSLPATSSMFRNRSQAWIGIKVGSDTLPRTPVTSVGFAFQAEHSEVCDELLGAAGDLT